MLRDRHHHHTGRLLTILLTTTLAACVIEESSAPSGDGEHQGSASQPLAGGTADDTDMGVVFVASNQTACSGVLIAPNVVVTSRICVAQATSGGPGTSIFDTPFPASEFTVVADQDFTAMTLVRHVTDVRVPADFDDVYDGNLAVLLLDEPFAQSESAPFVPRFGQPPQQGDTYRLVGYGSTCMSCGDAGERRRLDNLQIACVTGCGYDPPYDAKNFVGGGGLCEADGGAPALDSQDRIIGLGFAGSQDCVGSDYFSTIDQWEDFLVQAVVDGATLGCYEAPEWAGGPGTGAGGYGCGGGGTGGSGTGGSNAGGSATGGSGGSGAGGATEPATTDDDGGCSCRTQRASRPSWALGALAGLALLVTRRRRCRR